MRLRTPPTALPSSSRPPRCCLPFVFRSMDLASRAAAAREAHARGLGSAPCLTNAGTWHQVDWSPFRRCTCHVGMQAFGTKASVQPAPIQAGANAVGLTATVHSLRLRLTCCCV